MIIFASIRGGRWGQKCLKMGLRNIWMNQQNVAMTEMERRIEVYKKEAETARKWSASLANLHHIKVRFLICFRFMLFFGFVG